MKKILILLSILLITSCSFINRNNLFVDPKHASSKDYIEVIRNYRPREKNENNTVDDESFNEFLNDFFVDSYEDSYISYHYDFYDASSFGVEKPEVSWGILDEDKQRYIDKDIDSLNTLHNFDYDSLSYKQQFTYETIEYSLYEDLSSLTLDFDSSLLFTIGSNLLINLISTLTDFEIRDKESLDDYMILLADTDRYLQESIDYTNKVANEEHYYLTDFSIDYTEEYIDELTSSKNNVLITSFKERLNKTNFLNNSEKNKYINQNKEIVNNEILPVINQIRDTVESYRGMADSSDNLLRNIDKDLAEVEFTLATSSNQSIDEIFNNAINIYKDIEKEYMELINDETVQADLLKIENKEIEPLKKDYKGIIEFLENNYNKTHPDLGYIEYSVSSMDESSADPSTLAYYRDAPIDKPDLNIIKVNSSNFDNSNAYDIYLTLSHESIPGHMYDFYRYFVNDEDPIMRRLTYIGVIEGYAVYSSMCATTYLDIDPKTQRLLALDTAYNYIFDSILDIALNYYNYNDNEMMKLFRNFTFFEYDPYYYRNIFSSMPTSYSSYGIGVVKMMTLEKKVRNKLGDDYNQIEFNDLLTKFGRMPFVLIEDEVDKYIDSKLN